MGLQLGWSAPCWHLGALRVFIPPKKPSLNQYVPYPLFKPEKAFKKIKNPHVNTGRDRNTKIGFILHQIVVKTFFFLHKPFQIRR